MIYVRIFCQVNQKNVWKTWKKGFLEKQKTNNKKRERAHKEKQLTHVPTCILRAKHWSEYFISDKSAAQIKEAVI